MYKIYDMRLVTPILICSAIILIGCNSTTTDTTSPYAEVTAFTFAADTANPGPAKATYKIEQRTDTGLIYNTDSIAYGSTLTRVIPQATYKSTPATAQLIFPDTTVSLTGTDTLDFSIDPIYLYVKSSDLEHEKWYRISLTVHQQDPDLYVWQKLTAQIFEPQSCECKGFYINDKLILFVNNGLETQLFQSTDGTTWQTLTTPSGLPTPCRVRDILQHNDTLYYADNDILYSSTDVTNWTTQDYSTQTFSLVNMLVVFDDYAWGIVRDRTTSQLQLGYIHQGSMQPADSICGLTNDILPADFPVNDFAALPFSSASERPRAMIVGGRTDKGAPVNTRWNIEKDVNGTYRIKNFTIEQPNFHTLTGMSIIQYDTHLIMFGGIDNDLEWRSDMLFSDDEGMHWYTPDTAHNKLPETYQTRQKQTVLLDTEHNIYLIGGQSMTETFSDVYRGYLNSLKW